MLDAAHQTWTGSVLVAHGSGSVGDVRAGLRAELVARGLPEDAVEDVVLVVSEFVSNAIKHARPLEGGKIRLSWVRHDRCVEVGVTDGGGVTRPRLQQQTTYAAGGRGLAVVRRLSSDWGVREQEAGTTVWARIALDDAASTAAV